MWPQEASPWLSEMSNSVWPPLSRLCMRDACMHAPLPGQNPSAHAFNKRYGDAQVYKRMAQVASLPSLCAKGDLIGGNYWYTPMVADRSRPILCADQDTGSGQLTAASLRIVANTELLRAGVPILAATLPRLVLEQLQAAIDRAPGVFKKLLLLTPWLASKMLSRNEIVWPGRRAWVEGLARKQVGLTPPQKRNHHQTIPTTICP